MNDSTTNTIIESNQMDYSKKSRKELIAICKENSIKGYSGKKKNEIILLLNPIGTTPLTMEMDEGHHKFVYQTMLTCIGNKRKLVSNIRSVIDDIRNILSKD